MPNTNPDYSLKGSTCTTKTGTLEKARIIIQPIEK
jgi:hypothetical protein